MKNIPPKVVKDVRLTIRLDRRKKSIIEAIQNVFSDSVRGTMNETQAVEAALEIAAKKLNVVPKSSTIKGGGI